MNHSITKSSAQKDEFRDSLASKEFRPVRSLPMRVARHHLALRLLVGTSLLSGLFLACGACYLAFNKTAVFQNSPRHFRREEDVYTPVLLGIMLSALFFGGSVANRFLLNRYTLAPDYLEMEDFLTGRCTRIRPEEVATVEQFAI